MTVKNSPYMTSLTAAVAFDCVGPYNEPNEIAFEVESATAQCTSSGTDSRECTYAGSATLSLGPDDGGLTIFAGVLAGPHYRGYFGGAGKGPVTWTETCPTNNGSVTSTNSDGAGVWEFQSEETTDQYPQVGADGANLQGESSWGAAATYRWNLKAVREKGGRQSTLPG